MRVTLSGTGLLNGLKRRAGRSTDGGARHDGGTRRRRHGRVHHAAPQTKERKLREFCACRRCRGTDWPGKWRMSVVVVVVVVVVEGHSTFAVGGRRGWWDSDSNCEIAGTHLTRRTSDTHGGGTRDTRTRRTNRPMVWTARRDRDRGFGGLSGGDWGDKPWRGPGGRSGVQSSTEWALS